MKSGIELLKEYEIEECYVINRKRNNHAGYKEYFGSDGELVCLLQNYGFTIAKRCD